LLSVLFDPDDDVKGRINMLRDMITVIEPPEC
jgi:hypothetical protein